MNLRNKVVYKSPLLNCIIYRYDLLPANTRDVHKIKDRRVNNALDASLYMIVIKEYKNNKELTVYLYHFDYWNR